MFMARLAMRPRASAWPRASVLTRAASGESRNVQNWIPGPLEAAAFLPRLAVGGLLAASDKIPLLQPRLQKLAELANSPQSLDEKQAKVLAVLEEDVVDCLEKGADVEQALLQQLRAVLPADIAQQMPVPARPPSAASWSNATSTEDYYDSSSSTYTRTDVVEVEATPVAMPTQDAQTAAALVELRIAVGNLRQCIEQFEANGDATRTTMLRMNVQEARDRLSMRVMEIDGSVNQTPGLMIAIDEAKDLIADVNREL